MKKTSNMKKDRVIFRASNSERTLCPCAAFFLRLFLLTGVLFCCFIPSPLRAEGVTLPEDDSAGMSSLRFFPGDPGLDEVLCRLVRTLVEQGKLKDRPVLISPHDLYDAKTGLSLPLAVVMRGKLITEMKKEGVRVLLPGADEDRLMILQGAWQREGRYLAIDLKVMKVGPYGPEAVASASEKVTLGKIDADALTPDRESWARYLVRKLEQNTTSAGIRKVHLCDFKVKSKKCDPQFGPYLTGWLRPALAQGRMFVPLDQQKASKICRPRLFAPGEPAPSGWVCLNPMRGSPDGRPS